VTNASGAHLRFQGPKPANTAQIYGKRGQNSHILPLPSRWLGMYQIILLDDTCETHVCEQLAQGCYLAVTSWESNLWPRDLWPSSVHYD